MQIMRGFQELLAKCRVGQPGKRLSTLLEVESVKVDHAELRRYVVHISARGRHSRAGPQHGDDAGS